MDTKWPSEKRESKLKVKYLHQKASEFIESHQSQLAQKIFRDSVMDGNNAVLMDLEDGAREEVTKLARGCLQASAIFFEELIKQIPGNDDWEDETVACPRAIPPVKRMNPSGLGYL